MSMRIKKGDRVKVISGKDKGKEGKILSRNPSRDTILIEGVNMVTKHVRPSQKNPQAGIVKQEAPIYASKAMLVCPACGKATRGTSAQRAQARLTRRRWTASWPAWWT